SITEWLYRSVAGIDLDPEVPGYRSIVIHPIPGGGLEHAGAEYASIHGKIASAWRLQGSSFELDVAIPVNTMAMVYVPADEGAQVTESGKPAGQSEGVVLIKRESGCEVYALGSGTYRFASVLTP
ncbi:MAG: alpha-L-rhamnosidase, partial [Candidatus Glassbacteria bacterium]|nr:alpha-L-rhamnosidase [Candidatus Glassbacteria bacterium]